MPIYEFVCLKTGEVFEKIMDSSDWNRNYVICSIHFDKEKYLAGIPMHDAERIISRPANIQLGKPTRVFINPGTGKTRIATSDYEPTPWGYREVQLKGPIERSKFEKEEQRKLDATNEIITHQLDSQKEETRKNRQADINANLSSLAGESDNPEGAKHLIKSAMARTRKKRIRPKVSEVKFAVNHNNANNLDQVK